VKATVAKVVYFALRGKFCTMSHTHTHTHTHTHIFFNEDDEAEFEIHPNEGFTGYMERN